MCVRKTETQRSPVTKLSDLAMFRICFAPVRAQPTHVFIGFANVLGTGFTYASHTFDVCVHFMSVWYANRIFHFRVTYGLHARLRGELRYAQVPGSTAQGGSGSFRDRKPIGEVRCCESWMAEQIH